MAEVGKTMAGKETGVMKEVGGRSKEFGYNT